eukprot:1137609-Amphidinium_carterae.1
MSKKVPSACCRDIGAVHLQHRAEFASLYGRAHAGTADLTCEQAGMQLARRREAARALGQRFAVVYLDLQKAYEHVRHQSLCDAYANTPLHWPVLEGVT